MADASGMFEPIVHNFLAPQVKSALTSYLHSVLHDWGDDNYARILEQLNPLLNPTYSTLMLVPGAMKE
ncbi:hypothetical protein B0H14DRAFT_3446065 [Mycena olivaceomarginata]|nr:hypothetical protein B0H14DRAFT_3446065 [Mycena olivaceomarginata]